MDDLIKVHPAFKQSAEIFDQRLEHLIALVRVEPTDMDEVEKQKTVIRNILRSHLNMLAMDG